MDQSVLPVLFYSSPLAFVREIVVTLVTEWRRYLDAHRRQ